MDTDRKRPAYRVDTDEEKPAYRVDTVRMKPADRVDTFRKWSDWAGGGVGSWVGGGGGGGGNGDKERRYVENLSRRGRAIVEAGLGRVEIVAEKAFLCRQKGRGRAGAIERRGWEIVLNAEFGVWGIFRGAGKAD